MHFLDNTNWILKEHTSLIKTLKIRLINDLDQPIKMSKYLLEVDNQTFEGITNNEGVLQHDIPVGAKTGKLILDKKLFHRRKNHTDEIKVENWSIDLQIVDSMAPGDQMAVHKHALTTWVFLPAKRFMNNMKSKPGEQYKGSKQLIHLL